MTGTTATTERKTLTIPAAEQELDAAPDIRTARIPPAAKVRHALDYARRRLTRHRTEHGRYLDMSLTGDAEAEAKARKAAHAINELVIQITALEESLARADAHEAEREVKRKAAADREAWRNVRELLTENEADAVAIEKAVADIAERVGRMEGRARRAAAMAPRSGHTTYHNVFAFQGAAFDCMLAKHLPQYRHLRASLGDITLARTCYPAQLGEAHDAYMLNVPGAERIVPAPVAPVVHWEPAPIAKEPWPGPSKPLERGPTPPGTAETSDPLP